MHRSVRLERIVAWLERQGRWVDSTDLHRWQQANLGSTRSKRAHDVRSLVASGRIQRRRRAEGYEYSAFVVMPEPVQLPEHVLSRLRIERRLAERYAHERVALAVA
ncbi:MAG: hypothetical protein KTR31_27485 [Myxococcales bacterium]|nr:hypothetical protein [Myxococcales bacterium]